MPLKNYQPVLMKVLYEAGIKQIAEATGYHGETLTSLANGSNFKHTNTFLLQLHEAFLCEIITFTKSECEPALTGITNQVCTHSWAMYQQGTCVREDHLWKLQGNQTSCCVHLQWNKFTSISSALLNPGAQIIICGCFWSDLLWLTAWPTLLYF